MAFSGGGALSEDFPDPLCGFRKSLFGHGQGETDVAFSGFPEPASRGGGDAGFFQEEFAEGRGGVPIGDMHQT